MPVIGESVPITAMGDANILGNFYYNSLLSLACRAYYTNSAELFKATKFLMDEFGEALDKKEYPVVMFYLHEHEDACLLLAQRHSFNIAPVIYSCEANEIIMEKTMGIADPNMFKPSELDQVCRLTGTRELYRQNPTKVHKEMYIKHFGIQKACRVYVLILLIGNNILKLV